MFFTVLLMMFTVMDASGEGEYLIMTIYLSLQTSSFYKMM